MYHLRPRGGAEPEGVSTAEQGRQACQKGPGSSRRRVLVDVLQPALEALLLLVRGKGLLRQAAVVHNQAKGVVRVLLELGERQLEKGQQRPQLLAEPVWVLAVDCERRAGHLGG